MRFSGLLERIVGKQVDHERARAADFRDMVRRIADGKEPDAEVLARTLRDEGRSLGELTAAVDAMRRRRDLRSDLDRCRAVEAERPEIERQLVAANKTFEAAEAEHRETTRPLVWKLDDIAQAGRDAYRATQQLQDSCTDPALLEELAELRRLQSGLVGRKTELVQRLAEHDNRVHNHRVNASAARNEAEHRECVRLAEHHEAAVRCHKAEVAELDKRLAELNRRDAALRERMLEP